MSSTGATPVVCSSTIKEGRYQAAMKMAVDYLSLVREPAELAADSTYFEVRMGYNLCLYRLHRVDEGLAHIDEII